MTIKIDIYSDYIWPFCYVGMGLVEELKKEYDIEDRWLGLEIHPETPIDGVDLNKRFGSSQLEGMKDNLDHMGQQYGIKFGDLNFMPNSHNALEAAEYARNVGKLHEYHKELMEAFFRDSKDIGNVHILTEIGEKVGLDSKDLTDSIKEKRFESKLKQDARKAHSMGINSTPTFMINNEHMIVGTQPIEVFKNLFSEIDK